MHYSGSRSGGILQVLFNSGEGGYELRTLGAGLVEIDEDFSKIAFASPLCTSMRTLDLSWSQMHGRNRQICKMPLRMKQRTVRRSLGLVGPSTGLIQPCWSQPVFGGLIAVLFEWSGDGLLEHRTV